MTPVNTTRKHLASRHVNTRIAVQPNGDGAGCENTPRRLGQPLSAQERAMEGMLPPPPERSQASAPGGVLLRGAKHERWLAGPPLGRTPIGLTLLTKIMSGGAPAELCRMTDSVMIDDGDTVTFLFVELRPVQVVGKYMGVIYDAVSEVIGKRYIALDYAEEWSVAPPKRKTRADELREMPYGDYLQTRHWDEVRRAALERADFRCQLCNADAPLDAHHRTYERRCEERDNDVIALCRECHDLFHANRKLAE